MIKSSNKGMLFTFANGLTISIQIGRHNYCSQLEDGGDLKRAQDAEIAIWNEENKWYDFGTDEVKGWVSPDEIAGWIEKVQKAKDIESL